MTGEEKYQQLILKEPLKSVEFLVQTMGFEPVSADYEKAVLMQDKLGNYFELLLNPDPNCEEPVIINTNDCLSDYFELKTAGIDFISEPHYTPQGLMAGFRDSWGNNYNILEERFYEDNQ